MEGPLCDVFKPIIIVVLLVSVIPDTIHGHFLILPFSQWFVFPFSPFPLLAFGLFPHHTTDITTEEEPTLRIFFPYERKALPQ